MDNQLADDHGYYCYDEFGAVNMDIDTRYMERALQLAGEAARDGETPVGAVIVRRADGLIAGEGRNRREKLRNALAHAEIEAVDGACRTLGGWRLTGCDMYVNLEPCPMCAGAAVNARIDRIIFGAYDGKSGFCGSAADISRIGGIYRPGIVGGVMEGESGIIIKEFFGNLRRKRPENNMSESGNIKLVEAVSDDQLRRVAAIAEEIWTEYWTERLPRGQAEYMIEKFCTYEAQREYIKNEGYSYYFIKKGGCNVGYTAVKTDGERLFLSKLYLYKDERGKKYAGAAMAQIKEIARSRGLSAVWLTVNKHNDNTIAAYKAMGFETVGEGVADIGNGYVMDDFYMEVKV